MAPELTRRCLRALLCGLGACGRLGFGELPARGATDASVARDAGVVVRDAGADAGAIAADGCKRATIEDYCAHLPELPEAPHIDGTLDCGPRLVELPANGWTGSSPLPDNQRARFAAAWRPNGLYFYVEVDDPLRLPAGLTHDPWCGDGVEIYADSDAVYPSATVGYDDPGTIQLLAAAPATQTNAVRAMDERYRAPNLMSAGPWNGMHLMVVRDGGFALEAFVTASDLDLDDWILVAGVHVGFDLAINVSTSTADTRNCNQRLGQYFLHIMSDACTGERCLPYTNANAFCTTELE